MRGPKPRPGAELGVLAIPMALGAVVVVLTAIANLLFNAVPRGRS